MDTWPLSDTDDFQGGTSPDSGMVDYASLNPNVTGNQPWSNAAGNNNGPDAGTVHLAWLTVTGALILLVVLAVVFKGANQ